MGAEPLGQSLWRSQRDCETRRRAPITNKKTSRSALVSARCERPNHRALYQLDRGARLLARDASVQFTGPGISRAMRASKSPDALSGFALENDFRFADDRGITTGDANDRFDSTIVTFARDDAKHALFVLDIDRIE